MPKPPDPWAVIDALAATPATRYEWRQRLGSLYPAIEPLLRPAPSPPSLYVPCEACGMPVLVLGGNSIVPDHIATHDLSEPCRYSTKIVSSEARVVELDVRALTRHLRQALPITAPSQHDATLCPQMVGTLADSTARPIYLLQQSTSPGSLAWIAQLGETHPASAVLLSLVPRQHVRQLISLTGAQTHHIGLFLEWTPSGLTTTQVPFVETIARDAPPRVAMNALIPAVGRIEAKFDALASQHMVLQLENEKLKQSASACFAWLARSVQPDDFRAFAAVLAGGTVAAAARLIRTKDSTLRSVIAPWAHRNPAYRLMHDLIGWRKKIGRRINQQFDERWITTTAPEPEVIPDLLSELLDALKSQNSTNWQSVRAELVGLIQTERAP